MDPFKLEFVGRKRGRIWVQRGFLSAARVSAKVLKTRFLNDLSLWAGAGHSEPGLHKVGRVWVTIHDFSVVPPALRLSVMLLTRHLKIYLEGGMVLSFSLC